MLAENADRDVFLRHAGVQALAWIGDRGKLGELAAEPVASLRLSALLAMRKLRDPHIARFLDDPQRALRLEAARAINDLPMHALRPKLAASAARFAGTGDVGLAAEAPAPAHVFRRDVWKLGRAGTMGDLRTGGVFNRPPDESAPLEFGEAPRNAGNQFAARISGVIEAPESGEYVFAISSDDDGGAIFPSGNKKPSKKKMLKMLARADALADSGNDIGRGMAVCIRWLLGETSSEDMDDIVKLEESK
jgi:hypothetical protein